MDLDCLENITRDYGIDNVVIMQHYQLILNGQCSIIFILKRINTIMKINEVAYKNAQALFEELDQDNDTGVSTDDLVKIVEAHNSMNWSKSMTMEEMDAMEAGWLTESKNAT